MRTEEQENKLLEELAFVRLMRRYEAAVASYKNYPEDAGLKEEKNRYAAEVNALRATIRNGGKRPPLPVGAQGESLKRKRRWF